VAQERHPDPGNASASTPTLTLAGITTADAGEYDCIVSNIAGNAISAVAALTVKVGPVIINVARGVMLNGPANASGNPAWLQVHIASGGLTLNGASAFTGDVVASGGSVVVNNGALHGGVISDRLIVNGSGRVNQGGR
jgi:hypothetical protein